MNTWLRQRRLDIRQRLCIPKMNDCARESGILDERAQLVVTEYADGIMQKLSLESYFRYPQILEIISAVPAPFKLKYNNEGEGRE